ncbi:hypothetical protein [Streptomyces cucumeris]
MINALLRIVWKLQTDVERWPSWQTPVETVLKSATEACPHNRPH